MNRACGIALAAAMCIACGAPAPRSTPPAGPAHPAGFVLETVVPLAPGAHPRLRLDDAGRPYLVTETTIVPALRLPSGAPAQAFKLGEVATIGDVAWDADGVILVIVGTELGVVGPHGFEPILTLPTSNMRVVPASPGRAWLFAPGDPEGRLFLYDKSGTVTQLLRAGVEILDVSGAPDRAYVIAGRSLLRIGGDRADLVFVSDDDIHGVASTSTGVFLTTGAGTFFRSEDGAIGRITSGGALAIAARGDDLYLHVDGVGLVRGTPVSAYTTPTMFAAAGPAPPTETSGPSGSPGMRGRRKAAIVLGIAGLGLLGVGGGFAVSANRTYDDAHTSGHCDGQTICDDVGYAQIEDAHDAARISTITMSAGGGLLGLAAILWLTGGRSTSETHTAIVPRVGTSDIGLAIGGRF